MVQNESKTPSTKPIMKVQKWLSLGEVYAALRLKKGTRTPFSRDKVIGSLRTLHLATQVPQVVYGARRVKHWISAIWKGDKE